MTCNYGETLESDMCILCTYIRIHVQTVCLCAKSEVPGLSLFGSKHNGLVGLQSSTPSQTGIRVKRLAERNIRKDERYERMDGRMDRQMDRWRDGQTGRQTDKQTDQHIGRWTYLFSI